MLPRPAGFAQGKRWSRRTACTSTCAGSCRRRRWSRSSSLSDRWAHDAVIVHHERDPQMLYPELAEIGWTAVRIAGRRAKCASKLRTCAMKLAAGFLSREPRVASYRLDPVSFLRRCCCLPSARWIALFAGAQACHRFRGLGWPLAALHLVTLGVLAMTAIGASLQLLPVATRQPVRSKRWPAVITGGYTRPACGVALGMGMPAPRLRRAAPSLCRSDWRLRAIARAQSHRSRGMPVVVAHGWAALGSLVVVLATALCWRAPISGFRVRARHGARLARPPSLRTVSMGLLARGLSTSGTMFALPRRPDERRAGCR